MTNDKMTTDKINIDKMKTTIETNPTNIRQHPH